MDLPIYHELKLQSLDLEYLIASFKKHKVGKIPTFINLEKSTSDELRKALVNFLLVFKKLKINPRFPYPFYVITPNALKSNVIPLLGSVNELPNYFLCKNQKLTSRENSLLNKIAITRDKIYNIDLKQKNKETQELADNHRELYELVREFEYFNFIRRNLEGFE